MKKRQVDNLRGFAYDNEILTVARLLRIATRTEQLINKRSPHPISSV
jgi:hypothetical protein